MMMMMMMRGVVGYALRVGHDGDESEVEVRMGGRRREESEGFEG